MPLDFQTSRKTTYRGAGGGGTLDFANPTHATKPTASIIHPNMSYFRSLLPFFFGVMKEGKSMKLLACTELIMNVFSR